MKKIYIITTLAAITALCGCHRSNKEAPEVAPQKLALTVATADFDSADPAADSTQRILQRAFGGGEAAASDQNRSITRVGDAAFEINDSIGIYIHTANPLAPSTVHTPNMCFATYDGAIWTAEGQLSDILKSGTTYYATAYHPYLSNVTDPLKIVHSVRADQSTPRALSHSDLMRAPIVTMTNPTSAPAVALQFAHLLSKLAITLTVPAQVDGAAVTGIDRVVVRAVDRTVELNLATGATTAPTNKGDIKMCLTSGVIAAGNEVTYQAIIVPQTVAKNARFIEIYFKTASGEKAYLYNIEEELVLTPNLKHSRTLVSVGDLCFSSRLDLIDGLAKTKLPLKVKGLSGVAWTLTSAEAWLTLCGTEDGQYGASITGVGTGADQTVYVNVAANAAMVGDFWEPRTSKLELKSSGVSSSYTVRQNFYRFDLAPSTRNVAAMQSVVGVEGFGANQVWSAASGADWIKLASSVVYGQGSPSANYGPHSGSLASAKLFYQIEPNNSDTQRSGTVIFTPAMVGGVGASVVVNQAAADLTLLPVAEVSVGNVAGVDAKLFTVTAPLGVKWKVLSVTPQGAGDLDMGLALNLAVGEEQVGTGAAVQVTGSYGVNPKDARTASVVLSFATHAAAQQKTFTVKQASAGPPVNPPKETDYVTIGSLKWTKGNLVAVSGKTDECKVGAPTDHGLYFQFGSLLGWKGGAAGDGTGICTKADKSFYVGTTFNAASEIAVKPSLFTTLANIGTAWPDQTKNLYYFGDNTYATAYAKLRDFSGFSNGSLAASGVGDPCTYYLGSPWRLPTAEEFNALCNNAGNGVVPGSANAAWTTSPTAGMNFNNNSTKYFIPASGYRSSSDGAIYGVGTYGYCWFESVTSATNGYLLYFNSSSVYPQNNGNRRFGFPVRCVQDGPTEPQPPTADQIVTIGGLKWTTGNLVAAGGHNAKVGAPTDHGLYFQFGSLLGWKGGATGDGSGVSTKTTNGSFYVGTTFNAASEIAVTPSAFTTIANIGTTWPNQTKNLYYFGDNSYATEYAKLRDFTGFSAGTLADKGVGDPCTYYLGSTWRMPTAEEWKALCNNAPNNFSPATANAAWTTSPTAGMNFNNNSTKYFIPASGSRSYGNGSFYAVGQAGYYWSESVSSATNGYNLYFSSGYVYPQSNNDRRHGFPVRCVQ